MAPTREHETRGKIIPVPGTCLGSICPELKYLDNELRVNDLLDSWNGGTASTATRL